MPQALLKPECVVGVHVDLDDFLALHRSADQVGHGEREGGESGAVVRDLVAALGNTLGAAQLEKHLSHRLAAKLVRDCREGVGGKNSELVAGDSADGSAFVLNLDAVTGHDGLLGGGWDREHVRARGPSRMSFWDTPPRRNIKHENSNACLTQHSNARLPTLV